MDGSERLRRLGSVYTIALFCFAGMALTGLFAAGVPFLPLTFFEEQDLPVALVIVLVMLAMRSPRIPKAWIAALARLFDRARETPAAFLAAIVAILALAGAFSAIGTFPLSMDEFWARADGQTLASGQLLAEIPAQWREYAPAMQPIFTRISGDGAFWGSTYLPVNALFQGLLGQFAGPLFAGGAVLCLGVLANRQFPGDRGAIAVCLLLAATSAQWIVIGMTTYAMSAHLFFNLLWLCLAFRPGAVWQAAAMAVAFMATGLHQFAFFPVFAGFFVLEMFLGGRKGAAIAQAAAIAGAVVFWVMWDLISYKVMGSSPPLAKAAGPAFMVEQLVRLLTRTDFSSVSIMGFNLIRFQLWQNPLLVPLSVAAIPIAFKMKGFWRATVLSSLATVAFLAVVIPYQGHGWGYRYLHGILGNACLLAALAWGKLGCGEGRTGRAIFAATCLVAVVLVPLRFVQARTFVYPYAKADSVISATDADIVIIDAPQHMFANDLVRNLPEGKAGPVRMARAALTEQQLEALCNSHSLALFGEREAEAAGLPSLDFQPGLEPPGDPCLSGPLGTTGAEHP